MNFRGACGFVFWNAWTALIVNLNESKRSTQVKAQLDKTAYRSRHGTDNSSALVKASKNKALNPAPDEVRVENQAAVLAQSQYSSP